MAEVLKEIIRLFNLSEKEGDPRYIKAARDLARKHRKALPPELRTKFCKSCNAPFRFGENCSVRVTKKSVQIHCQNCGYVRRVKVEQNI